ncbi:xylulokinase [Paenibacillus tianmuensis]|uniref:Xylulose kinase n=1 Tax=Paenibacillus tianmuensis TaxID=624147 RepID=A0A1G4QGC3_9BACL|nr:xylulokinase [Paenibacillus tianmuensis]SCW43650.1 xylulokinase [Paenibacillus tianmuensis]
MKYVIGIDLGTSAVKVILVNREGEIVGKASEPYPISHERPGFSEQDPEQWVSQTLSALKKLLESTPIAPEHIEGISFSGQMHGLVLLDKHRQVLRPAILWNDTRTTKQCKEIETKLGSRLLDITRNSALEGFTLPKIIWVQENEPEVWSKTDVFLLPKDYLRFRLTGRVHMEISDAAGTLMLDVPNRSWSEEIAAEFGLDRHLFAELVPSLQQMGTLLPEIARQTGLRPETKVFAGGADNACGAIGAGIVKQGVALSSIGTSGVVLTCENNRNKDFGGKVHFFNHAEPDAYYAMGVTLAAGYSLNWFKQLFAQSISFEELLQPVADVPVGAGGILFTPYLVGERTPHADSVIRGSFIGLSGSHSRAQLTRAVLEGITFSLQESVELFREARIRVEKVVSIGGGAKSAAWLQIQADIFDAPVVSLKNEQGPAMGAAMIAAVGAGWFSSLPNCADSFIDYGEMYEPIKENVIKYKQLFRLYRDVYTSTRTLNERLKEFR